MTINQRIIIPSLMMVLVTVYFSACGGGLGTELKNDPLKPAPELKEGTLDPTKNTITISKSDITITVDHWSRARLDRKFTTADMRSPFFYLDTWPQSLQSEVFHLTIKNNTPRSIKIVEKETKLYDDRQYEYIPVDLDMIRYKFTSKSYMDLKTKNGLELAPQILLLEKLGPSRSIAAGATAEGFLPFYTPSPQAEKVWLIVTIEKEPENPTAIPEKVTFRFDYRQDLVLRKTQPPAKR